MSNETAGGARFGFGCVLGVVVALAVVIGIPTLMCCSGVWGVGAVGNELQQTFDEAAREL